MRIDGGVPLIDWRPKQKGLPRPRIVLQRPPRRLGARLGERRVGCFGAVF